MHMFVALGKIHMTSKAGESFFKTITGASIHLYL
jgi:hypothetical protein